MNKLKKYVGEIYKEQVLSRKDLILKELPENIEQEIRNLA